MKEYLIKTTSTLRLEFRQILKIDNLQDLTSLTRLFLDNNFIEKITGLEFLNNLVWLDLSFNKIRKIDGLASQKNLQVLALYQNEIKVRLFIFYFYQQISNLIFLPSFLGSRKFGTYGKS